METSIDMDSLRKLYDWLARSGLTSGEKTVLKASIYIVLALPLLLALGAAVSQLFFAVEQRRVAPAGCKRLGLHWRAAFTERQTRQQERVDGGESCRVKSLWIYPIKSCRGIELNEAEVVSTGFRFDRQFCLAQLLSPFPVSDSDSHEARSAHKWRFITQREFSMLSQVRTELWVPDPSRADYNPSLPDVRTGGAIVLRFPYREDGWRGALASLAATLRGTVPERAFKIPFAPSDADVGTRFPREAVTIWKESPVGINMSALLPAELRYALGVRNPLGLFRVAAPRAVHRMTPSAAALGWQPATGFADAFPLHVLGAASVRALSKQQPRGAPPLDVRRFRPNVVVEGSTAFAEDAWKRLRVREGEYYVAGRCVRCRLPNVNPDTGVRHKAEPDRTLRAERDVDRGAPGKGCLGINMGCTQQSGSIRVGDKITVLETGENIYEQI